MYIHCMPGRCCGVRTENLKAIGVYSGEEVFRASPFQYLGPILATRVFAHSVVLHFTQCFLLLCFDG